MGLTLDARVLVDGRARGRIMRLEPLSFWGGVDPSTGRVTQPRHHRHGETLAGRIVVMRRVIGSSSSSAVVLELIHRGAAPAGIVLGEPDAIVPIGVIVAREMDLPTLPVVCADPERLPDGALASIEPGGRVRVEI